MPSEAAAIRGPMVSKRWAAFESTGSLIDSIRAVSQAPTMLSRHERTRSSRPPIVSSIGTSNDDPNVYLSEAADKGQNGVGSEPDHTVAVWLAGFGGRKAAGLDVLHEVDVGVLQILGVAEFVVEVPSTGERDPGPGRASESRHDVRVGESASEFNGVEVDAVDERVLGAVFVGPAAFEAGAQCRELRGLELVEIDADGSSRLGAPGPMSTSTRNLAGRSAAWIDPHDCVGTFGDEPDDAGTHDDAVVGVDDPGQFEPRRFGRPRGRSNALRNEWLLL